MPAAKKVFTKDEISQIDKDIEERIRRELGIPADPALDAVEKAAKAVVKAQAKLDVAMIDAYETGNYGARKIAERAGVSHMTVMRLLRKTNGIPER